MQIQKGELLAGPSPSGSTNASSSSKKAMALLGNLSTAYNLVVVNLVLVALSHIDNGKYDEGTLSELESSVATASLVGAIVGQVIFGYIGDCLGREKGMLLTLFISVLGAVGSSTATDPGEGGGGVNLYIQLSIWRVLLGIGVGGVYPLAAVLATESSSDDQKGKSAAIVFAMQGVGQMLAPAVFWLLLQVAPQTVVWRVAILVGAVPGLVSLGQKSYSYYLERKVHYSSLRQDSDSGDSLTDGTSDGSRTTAVPASASSGKHATSPSLWKLLGTSAIRDNLIGCAGTWFIFDITFYGNAIFGPIVLEQIFQSSKDPQGTAIEMLFVSVIGMPGYLMSVYFMDRWGPRKIQLLGFTMMALIFLVIGVFFQALLQTKWLLMILYGLTFFFSNFGPNSTTFILPSQNFPKESRSSLNGLCAAFGKAGAALGAACFKPLLDHIGVSGVLIVCGVTSLLGLALTFFYVNVPSITPPPATDSTYQRV